MVLENEEIEIIRQNLNKGLDVEIQHRKDGIVILTSKKKVCYKQTKPESTKENPKRADRTT